MEKKIQVESVSSFKIRNTCEKEAGLKLTHYICHRCGVANPTSNRIPHAKASGSVKCGFTFPAMITVSRRSIDGVIEINVQYKSVHVEHDIEAGKLHLKKDERSALELSQELDISKAKILDKTREAYSPDDSDDAKSQINGEKCAGWFT
ncbi:c2H2-type domain-containing protein [Nephila pilipes]|uniref:C2H2-type domain-containing protein n=1 Tax=Nephila pilipes TaxID=299642 RepID=A0A8X6K7Q7_NEPPI|nr:c2H2-type domain-containing protein [Nephila pilipes]